MLLAVICALEFFMLRNMKHAITAQDARIAHLENAVATIEHRLNTVRIVPLVTSDSR
jgi:hypothetical protein